jgi:hypothetical protein
MSTDDTTRPARPVEGPEEAAATTGTLAPLPPARSRGLRMRTLVLGLVLLAISVTTTIRLLTDVHVDNGVVLLVLLLAAGALLLGGGVLGATREARGPQN